jgi:hypothetical protein
MKPTSTCPLVIGMSVLEIRDNTMKNMRYLQKLAEENSAIEIIVFNKTQIDLIGEVTFNNLQVIETPKESLYETMAKLSVKDDSHIIWLNDDDEFCLSVFDDFLSACSTTTLLPKLRMVTTGGEELVDWRTFVSAAKPHHRYNAYWGIAAPLIFSFIPGRLFNTWISYINDLPVHLPHLDTQLNVLVCLSNKVEIARGYTYVYDARNWESSEKQILNAERHAKFLGLDESSVGAFAFARRIDDVAIVKYAQNKGLTNTNKLEKRLLSQFTPIQGAGKNFLLRNFGTRAMRRRHIQEIPTPSFQNEFIVNIPRRLQEIFTGVQTLRSARNLASALSEPGVAKSMRLPQELIDFWVKTLSE